MTNPSPIPEAAEEPWIVRQARKDIDGGVGLEPTWTSNAIIEVWNAKVALAEATRKLDVEMAVSKALEEQQIAELDR